MLEDLRVDGRPLHTGIRYGVSQALLGLIANAAGAEPAQLLAQLLGRDELRPVPLYSQSGEDRYRGVDKMIMKRVEVLPHGLINSPALFGDDGSVFLEYATFVRDRVLEFGDSDYRPNSSLRCVRTARTADGRLYGENAGLLRTSGRPLPAAQDPARGSNLWVER